MAMRYWILTLVVAAASFWVLSYYADVPLAFFLAIWPSSLAALWGLFKSERALESKMKEPGSVESSLSDPAE